MLEQALSLARQGFKVFPIAAGAKKPPLVSGWQHVATTDAARVTAWWTQWPDANVGIHCDGFIVIDVDPKKGGYESLARLELELDLPATYEVSTPSGGRHIYYRYAGVQCRNGVDILGQGVDVRTTAGYVVGPGSRVGDVHYTVHRDCAPAVAPAALAARCVAPEAPDIPQADVETDAQAAVERARDFLTRHPVAIEGQGGDAHTYAVVCRLRDFGVPRERAAEALADWNARCEPPWDAGDLAVKIRNAYSYAQNAAGKLTPEALGFEPIAGADAPAVEQAPTVRSLIHPAEIEGATVLKAEYLIKGVLEKQSNAVLFGQWNVGKTFVVLDIAASIACGVTGWFGHRVRAGRVLYLGYEGARAMKKRLIALREKYPALKNIETPFRYEGMMAPLTQPEGAQEVREIMYSYKKLHGGYPDLLIIDPLANALGGDDSDATLMSQLSQAVASIMKHYGCTVLRVHHAGHANQDRARGHSMLPAGVDTEIRVSRGEIVLTKQRDDVTDGILHFDLPVVKLGKDADNDDVTTCVVEEVHDNAMDPRLTQPQRALLDRLLEMHGNEGRASEQDIRDLLPGLTPTQRRALVGDLMRKCYLRKDGRTYLILERGPMAVFD